jgi:hypothetical protein
MMFGVRPKPVASAAAPVVLPVVSGVGPGPAVPQPVRPAELAEPGAAPCGVLGTAVPLTSPAGPGAIAVPPGPTR